MFNACTKKFFHAARTIHDDFIEAQIENESEYEMIPNEPIPKNSSAGIVSVQVWEPLLSSINHLLEDYS